ncbi:Nitrite-sensitive transcriptional repressor NsrR [hydrothermal vent metagenome]|uniref:Nitrite-sensitive transcriptional repressor NsrR n=1 Tax=hydrothermal vent metagenome TaxID=652676 RepID=A0A3B0RCW7_9ZZZZ
MHISQFSDYSLRVLIFLVTCKKPTTATAIAEAYDISFHHVSKAAQFLAREGYVASERGRSGGIRLALAAKEISIGEVLRKSEKGNVALVECMRPKGKPCVIVPVCKLAGTLRKAQEAFFDYLDKVTLADITSNEESLKNILEKNILESGLGAGNAACR